MTSPIVLNGDVGGLEFCLRENGTELSNSQNEFRHQCLKSPNSKDSQQALDRMDHGAFGTSRHGP